MSQVKTPAISVIVPVYNTAKYLDDCVKSVLSQTFKDFELILVDDGSTDGSGIICDKYSCIDTRVITIHKKNEGVSAARNLGITLAKGNWLIFLDADDLWSDNEALFKLYSAAISNNVDIVRGEYQEITANGEKIKRATDIGTKKKFAHQIINTQQFHDNIIEGEYFLVLCLIKTSLKDYLKFDEEQIYLEDMKVYINILMQNIKCLYIDNVFYSYRKHQDAVTSTANPCKIIDSFRMCRFFLNKLNSVTTVEFKDTLSHLAMNMYYVSVFQLSAKCYDSTRNSIIREIIPLHLNQDIKNTKHIYGKSIMKMIILKTNPSTGCRIFRIRGKIVDIIKHIIRHE